MKNFTPDQVRAMSVAEASAAIEGFISLKRAEAGHSDAGPPPTMDEIEEMMRLYPDT